MSLTGGTINFGAAAATIDSGATSATISSVLTGTAGLTKAGTGTLTLSGVNTFSGGINVTAGTLSITTNAAFGDATNGVTLASGTGLTLTGATGASRVVTLTSGNVTLSGGSVAARFTGAGGLLVQPGVALVNNASDYTGQTQFTGLGGNYTFSSIANLGVASALGAPTTVANGTVLVAVTPTVTNPVVVYNGSGHSSNRNWTFQNPSNGGSSRLRNSGSGTLTLTGDILMSGPGFLGTTFEASTSNLALLGVINSSVRKDVTYTGTSARTITLGGANTYTGNSTISTVTVQAPVLADLGVVSSLGTASGASGLIIVNINGRLSYTGAGASTNRPWALNNGTINSDGAGALALTGTMTITNTATLGGSFSGAANSISGVISGTGALAVNGAGTWALTNSNTYTGGTAINAGVLQVSSDANLGAAAGGLSFGGGTLRTTAALTTNRATTLNAGGGTVDTNGFDVTMGGLVSGTGALTKAGAGTLTLTGADTYSGGTTITAGTLQLGAGGASGGIVGNVTDNGILVFNRSDAVTFAGLISGAGAVSQIGAGTTTLTGANTYAGPTTISTGTLFVNGNQSAAAGATSVASGATLGGTGIIGGDVSVAGGGTLAPGNSPGTLTINGNLSLAGSSLLDYEFGQSNIVGGPLNDLTAVGGNLVLDGTINVTVSPGGSFDIGLYRVINYGGTLTDNGLALGTLPAGSTVFVQTSIANQVNLVNTTGATLNFWDGVAGPKFNNAINGGNGVWQSGAGNDNWADVSGAVNAPYSNGAFAIFSAAPGTVTIDNGLGNVTATGMQFASNGYAITGDALTLVGPQSVVRVGDGTAAGAGYTATIGAALTGTTQVVKTDLGTLVLSGVNSYSGGTLISAGTLRISSDANLGAAAGGLGFDGGTLNTTASFVSARNVALTGAGTLLTDAGTTLTLNGLVSGTGALTKAGAGTTILTGANTYTGGTTITAGTLVGPATSFGNGAIMDNAALVIDQPADAAFANAIDGTGSLTKQGAGRLNYTGTGTLSGATTVTAGLLSVNGSLANSAVTVQSGASLGGTGTVGATTVQSGGAVAPGNSIGALQINGAFIQVAGSTYQVEVDPNSNASDLIVVNGAATLQSGAGLNVTKSVPGEYQVGTIYTVLTASGGLSGNYTVTGQTSSASAFLGLKDSYDANNAYLTVIQTQPLTNVAATPNQQAVANAVQNLPPVSNPSTGTPAPNPVQSAVLNLPDAPSARAAFDQLSGQSQASAQGALLSNGLYMREVAFDRLRDVVCIPTGQEKPRCDGKRLSIWEQGFGGWGGIAGNGNATGLNHSAAGFLVGVDVPVFDWRLGFFGGYSHSDFRLVTGGANGESNDYHLGAYGGTLLDGIAVRLGASYSWNGITTDRSVLIGSFSDALHSIYNGGTTQAFGELGYRLDMEGISMEPFANLTYVSLRTGSFSESGGAAALAVRANTIEDTVTTLGIRPSIDIALYGLEGRLRGMVGWRHTFGDITPTSLVSFAGGNAFSVSGVPIARDAAALEAGLDVILEEGLTLGLTYGGQFSGQTTDQTARGTIRVGF